MALGTRSKITGFGSYVPEKVLRNSDFEKMVDTEDEWIIQRTGIRERHISEKDEHSSDLAVKAVLDLEKRYAISYSDADLIIVTTFTPDHFTPHVAAMVQGRLGIKKAGTFDLGSGCTGYAYALATADALVSSGHFNKALVIAAEAVSKAVDYSDRLSCILFGDAGAACIVERCEDEGSFIASEFTSDGDIGYYVTTTNYSNSVLGKHIDKKSTFQQDGQQVYKYVVKNVPAGISRLLDKAGLTMEDIDWFVPHSANLRIIEAVAKKIGMPMEKTLTSVEYFGNTSSASIPLAISEAQKKGRLKPGDTAMLYGFGGGLTHGGVIVKL